jgi:hypothetical protein
MLVRTTCAGCRRLSVAFGGQVMRQLASILLTAFLATSVLTPSLSWLFPCLWVTRLEPCHEASGLRDDGTPVPSNCMFGSCDWHPTLSDQLERGVVIATLLVMSGMIAASLSERRPLRAAALSGAVAVAITLLLDRFLYGYGAVSFIDILMSAIPIGLGALLAWCGGWVALRLTPSKTSEPTR